MRWLCDPAFGCEWRGRRGGEKRIERGRVGDVTLFVSLGIWWRGICRQGYLIATALFTNPEAEPRHSTGPLLMPKRLPYSVRLKPPQSFPNQLHSNSGFPSLESRLSTRCAPNDPSAQCTAHHQIECRTCGDGSRPLHTCKCASFCGTLVGNTELYFPERAVTLPMLRDLNKY